jgi:hypothetical protein
MLGVREPYSKRVHTERKLFRREFQVTLEDSCSCSWLFLDVADMKDKNSANV